MSLFGSKHLCEQIRVINDCFILANFSQPTNQKVPRFSGGTDPAAK